MISGRTRTAEQRAAGAETREDTGMGTVAAAETEETAGTERRAVAEMEEVAAEETEEAAVAEIAEAAGDMAGDTEPAAAGDRRVREALRDARVLKDRGRFFLVHRPFRLVELMATLTKYKLEPKRMQLVYPFIDKEPNMVLIEACKGGNSRIRVERPLVVYERPGVYTEDVLELYRMV